MQNHTADQLHVEVPHLEHAPPSLAHDRKGFHQNVVENLLQRFVFLFLELLLLIKIGLVVGRRACGLRLRKFC